MTSGKVSSIRYQDSRASPIVNNIGSRRTPTAGQKQYHSNNSLPPSDGGNSSVAGGDSGKTDTFQWKLWRMEISLNLMPVTSRSKRSWKQSLPPAGSTDFKAKTHQVLEQYVKNSTLVGQATSHLKKLTRAINETESGADFKITVSYRPIADHIWVFQNICKSAICQTTW